MIRGFNMATSDAMRRCHVAARRTMTYAPKAYTSVVACFEGALFWIISPAWHAIAHCENTSNYPLLSMSLFFIFMLYYSGAPASLGHVLGRFPLESPAKLMAFRFIVLQEVTDLLSLSHLIFTAAPLRLFKFQR